MRRDGPANWEILRGQREFVWLAEAAAIMGANTYFIEAIYEIPMTALTQRGQHDKNADNINKRVDAKPRELCSPTMSESVE